jgi:hypothetical protein
MRITGTCGRKKIHMLYFQEHFKIFHKFVGWLTGDIYADFLDAELPNLLEDIPLVFRINNMIAHHHISVDELEKFWIILIDG